MKTIFTLIVNILLVWCALFGQDTTYYDSDGDVVESLKLSDYYKVIERDENDTNKVVERAYFQSGQIKHEKNYHSYSEKKIHGKRREWYENGQIRRDIDYKNGKLNGQVLTYWDNGQLKREDTYQDGEFVDGRVWNSKGKKVKYYDFQVMPQFPGGIDNLIQYIGNAVSYPEVSKEAGIEGRVLLTFIVEKDGSVSNIKIKESVSKEIDEEAMRVIKEMPKWSPGKEDGELIRVMFGVPINFKLDSSSN